MLKFNKYGILRTNIHDDGEVIAGFVSFVSTRCGTGFHVGGYTSPDFITSYDKKELEKYLYNERKDLKDEIVLVDDYVFAITLQTLGKHIDYAEKLNVNEWAFCWCWLKQLTDSDIYNRITDFNETIKNINTSYDIATTVSRKELK